MAKKIKNGTKRTVRGKPSIYYDGYWIRRYELEDDTLANKKRLIDQLARRVFHHVEPGLNTPGYRLEEIRERYESETDPARKRVKAGMLAGALVNRGKDILTSVVELVEIGIDLKHADGLLHLCGECFIEALNLGKNIKLASGEEGLDELWGEPFKVFSHSMEEFYESRYIKVAQAMRQIDQVTGELIRIVEKAKGFENAKPLIVEFAESAKAACETLRSDPIIFEVWPRYVAAKEALEDYTPEPGSDPKREYEVLKIIQGARSLLVDLSTVRVPMPKSVQDFMDRCDAYHGESANN